MSQKTPFDHINAIYNNQRLDYYDTLTDHDKKTFNAYVISMGISMNWDFLPIVNIANRYWDELSPRSLYLFYSQLIPKGKYFNKWVKGKKDASYEPWLIQLVSKKYEISHDEATVYISIFLKTDEGRAELREICTGFGVDEKKLKKAKL